MVSFILGLKRRIHPERHSEHIHFIQYKSSLTIRNQTESNIILFIINNYCFRLLGASSGIGQGTAILFSKLGAKLAITGRNDANLKKTADECEKNGGVKVT